MEPGATTRTTRLDYFGNETSTFTVAGVHRSLKVTATSQVELLPRRAPADSPAWEAAREFLDASLTPADIDAQQFVYASQFIPKLPVLTEYATPSFPPGRPLLQAALDLSAHLSRF